jgi:hypothetical protein
MMTALGLRREKIAATFDKRQLAQSIAVVVESLRSATKTPRTDFWINVDLNVHIHGKTAFDKHARINVYVSSDVGSLVRDTGGKVVPPDKTHRVRIQAELDEMTVARAMAWVVKTLVDSVQTEREDFWVNVDLNVHIKRGKAYEKKARLNVYGDLIDPCDTTIVESIDWDEIPPEALGTLSDTTITESVDWNEVPSEILGTLCENFEETQK